jgi:hypothetical protein
MSCTQTRRVVSIASVKLLHDVTERAASKNQFYHTFIYLIDTYKFKLGG